MPGRLHRQGLLETRALAFGIAQRVEARQPATAIPFAAPISSSPGLGCLTQP
jgi:hypothetical protein